MKHKLLALAASLLMVAGSATVWGQEETTPGAPPASEPAKAAPAAAESPESPSQPGAHARGFKELYEEWKAILSELRDLKYAQYPEAGVDRRVEISKRYDELIARGEALQDDLVASAIEAFKEAPKSDPTVTQFLGVIVDWDCQTDDYENALELAQILIEHGWEHPSLYARTGEAAFCTNRFDLAEEYFKKAEAGEALSEHQEGQLSTIGYYKVEWEKEKKIREAEAAADDLPRVLIKTEHGDIVLELFENEAPNTVANFISLVKKGFYDGLTFHRVLPQFMAQGGCPLGNGHGGPGYRIECECVRKDSRKHFRGSISMAHSGPDTGGSQFFLCFVPSIGLDGPPSPNHHTVFGRVIEGMEHLAEIQRRDPEKENPPEPDKILEMKVLRDRGHEYEPKTLPPLR